MNGQSEKNAPALIRGNILAALVRFALPVLLALFLQAMYGAADLIIVGRFAGTAEQSGVASGSQLFNLITMMITGLSMGVTVLVGNAVGSGEKQLAGRAVGCGAVLFGLVAVVMLLSAASLLYGRKGAFHAGEADGETFFFYPDGERNSSAKNNPGKGAAWPSTLRSDKSNDMTYEGVASHTAYSVLRPFFCRKARKRGGF